MLTLDKKKQSGILQAPCHFGTGLYMENEMSNKPLHTRLAEAVNDHDPKCHSEIKVDSKKVQVSGIVPGPARGLFALKHDLVDELRDLERQMNAIRRTISAADKMAQQIIMDAYPAVNDRKGFLLMKDWGFVAHGPDEREQHKRRDRKRVEELVAREQLRMENGDEIDDDDEGLAQFMKATESRRGKPRRFDS